MVNCIKMFDRLFFIWDGTLRYGYVSEIGQTDKYELVNVSNGYIITMDDGFTDKKKVTSEQLFYSYEDAVNYIKSKGLSTGKHLEKRRDDYCTKYIATAKITNKDCLRKIIAYVKQIRRRYDYFLPFDTDSPHDEELYERINRYGFVVLQLVTHSDTLFLEENTDDYCLPCTIPQEDFLGRLKDTIKWAKEEIAKNHTEIRKQKCKLGDAETILKHHSIFFLDYLRYANITLYDDLPCTLRFVTEHEFNDMHYDDSDVDSINGLVIDGVTLNKAREEKYYRLRFADGAAKKFDNKKYYLVDAKAFYEEGSNLCHAMILTVLGETSPRSIPKKRTFEEEIASLTERDREEALSKGVTVVYYNPREFGLIVADKKQFLSVYELLVKQLNASMCTGHIWSHKQTFEEALREIETMERKAVIDCRYLEGYERWEMDVRHYNIKPYEGGFGYEKVKNLKSFLSDIK